MITFKEIEIKGLFGESDVRIPIKDNRLILVGYNGIGKSTVLNIFYYLISQQWSKLLDQDFSQLTVRLKNNNRKFTVERGDISEYVHFARRRRRRSKRIRGIPTSIYLEAEKVISRELRQPYMRGSSVSSRRHLTSVLIEELRVPMRIAEELTLEYRHSPQESFEFESETLKKLSELDDFISENLQGRILYLPTYRRIEKDIKTVFPEIEDELQRQLSRRSHEHGSNENFIEFVQFGMEDVKSKISSRLETIKAYALSQINSLTTKYLRDVIRNEANQYEGITPEEINEESLKTVFNKVDSTLLSDDDKLKIQEVVQKIRDGRELQENEKYVAHYVLYLVEIGKSISRREASILRFVEICNSYLYGKHFGFDNIGYNVFVRHATGRPVELEDLSSGEKQIVSLFSHLILDEDPNNYIIIDEPELSLSVDWQQKFLEDISNLETCKFICAVTHSPFIFENSLDDHTVDLLEHTKGIQ